MKIFLVNASQEDARSKFFYWLVGDDRFKLYPVGLAYLAAILEEKGHDVRCFNFGDIPFKKVRDKFLTEVDRERPDIVGFSVLTANRTATFELVRRIKNIYSPLIITGGVHCSTLYGQILDNYPVDIVCTGESETIINRVVEGDLATPGIAYKNDGKVVWNGPTPPITDLESLPFPKHEAFLTKRSTDACIITSRGCPASCTFCSSSAYWGHRWRARSAENILDEIEHIKKMFPNVKRVYFYDDSFTIDNERVIRFCRGLISRKIRISWSCIAHVTPISLKMLRWMKRSKCTSIVLGVESGSPKILESLKKYITREQIIKAFRLARQAKVNVGSFLIVGLPGETDETVGETVDLLKKIHIGSDSVGVLLVYPNTEVYNRAKEEGFIDDDYWLTDKKVPYYTQEHSLDELNGMCFRIIYESKRNVGLRCIVPFVLKKAVTRPAVVLRSIKHAFGNRSCVVGEHE